MKKFIFIIAVYILLLGGMVLIVNGVYESKWGGHGTERFQNVPEHIQISDFGMSHCALGFDYDAFSDDLVCFNFAMGSQWPSDDLRIMKCYLENLETGGIIFLGVSYPSMFGLPLEKEPDFLTRNQRYYTFLPKELIKQYKPMIRIYANYLPALVAGRFLVPTLMQKKPENETQTLVPMNTPEHGYQRYLDHVKSKHDDDGNLIVNQEEIDAYYEMIEICRQKGITPILITVPYLREYTDTVKGNDPEFLEAFYGVIDQISRETGVTYYDYSNDERFRNDHSLFNDTDHLNTDGAKKFTAIVFDEIVNPMLTG